MLMPIDYLYMVRDRSAERRYWEKHYRAKGLVSGRKLDKLVHQRMSALNNQRRK